MSFIVIISLLGLFIFIMSLITGGEQKEKKKIKDLR